MRTIRLLPLLLASALAVRADVIPPQQDVASSKGKISAAAGKATTLAVSATSKAFIRFDLSALPSDVMGLEIQNARLRLYFPSVTKVGDLEIHAVIQPWVEGIAGAEPTVDPIVVNTVLAASIAAKKFTEIDLTPLVKRWRNFPAMNLGLAIVATGTTKLTLGAKEGTGSGYPAELDIQVERFGGVDAGSIGTAQLADGAVTSAKLANGAVGATQLGNGAVGAAQLANGAVGNGQLANGAVTSAKLANGAIGNSQLAANLTLSGDVAFTGTLILPATVSVAGGTIEQNGSTLLYSTDYSFFGGGAGPLAVPPAFTSANVGIGNFALRAVSSGVGNIALGDGALNKITTGNSNIAFGPGALSSSQIGSRNVAIGINAGSLLASFADNIAIAHEGTATDSGTIRIGTAGTQVRTFVSGIRSVTTGVNNAVPVVIDGNGQLGTVSSSRRYKEAIADMGDASARLEALRPVTFHYQQPYADGSQPTQFGLIAEEVAAAFPELAVLDTEGRPETVKYQDLTPMLLNEFLKERRRARTEQTRLREENAELKARLDRLEKRLGQP